MRLQYNKISLFVVCFFVPLLQSTKARKRPHTLREMGRQVSSYYLANLFAEDDVRKDTQEWQCNTCHANVRDQYKSKHVCIIVTQASFCDSEDKDKKKEHGEKTI